MINKITLSVDQDKSLDTASLNQPINLWSINSFVMNFLVNQTTLITW